MHMCTWIVHYMYIIFVKGKSIYIYHVCTIMHIHYSHGTVCLFVFIFPGVVQVHRFLNCHRIILIVKQHFTEGNYAVCSVLVRQISQLWVITITYTAFWTALAPWSMAESPPSNSRTSTWRTALHNNPRVVVLKAEDVYQYSVHLMALSSTLLCKV